MFMPAERFDFRNAEGQTLAALIARGAKFARSRCSRTALPAASTTGLRAISLTD
jgi:hypothetical protein